MGSWAEEAAVNVFITVVLFVAAWAYAHKKRSSVESDIALRSKPQDAALDSSSPPNARKFTSCANCTTESTKLAACARCGLVAYCSKDCQRAHWKASHKVACVAQPDAKSSSQTNSHGRTLKEVKEGAVSETAGNSEAFFGATDAEREELLDELSELSPKEKQELMKSWGQLSSEELVEAPTSAQIEVSLKAHREEMASLMYDAAYKPLSGSDTAALIARMRELKELTALEQELLDTQVAEDKELDRVRGELLKVKQTTGRSASMCLPCDLPPEKNAGLKKKSN